MFESLVNLLRGDILHVSDTGFSMTLDFTNMINEVDPNLFVPPDNCIESFDLVSFCSFLMITVPVPSLK